MARAETIHGIKEAFTSFAAIFLAFGIRGLEAVEEVSGAVKDKSRDTLASLRS